MFYLDWRIKRQKSSQPRTGWSLFCCTMTINCVHSHGRVNCTESSKESAPKISQSSQLRGLSEKNLKLQQFFPNPVNFEAQQLVTS